MRTQLGLLRGAVLAVLIVLGLPSAPTAHAQAATPPSATMDAKDVIRDGEALLPLQDWTPLVNFVMSTPAETPAFRTLEEFEYTITGDKVEKRDWERYSSPSQADLLEFALFEEGGDPEADYDGVLNHNDHLLIRWGNDGAPYGVLNFAGGGLHYVLNFQSANITISGGQIKRSFILCVRTSPYWQTATHMGVIFNIAKMYDASHSIPVNPGPPPALLDSYPQDWFTTADPFVDEKTGYSACFNVFDVTSGPQSTLPTNSNNQLFQNAWNWPHFMYTPKAEYMRPRYDIPGNFFDYVTGEWLQIRNLFPLETWVPLIGINVHSTAGPTPAGASGIEQFQRFLDADGNAFPAMLREVNVVVQDIGGDPLVPGSGGFNPVTGLDTLTNHWQGNSFSGFDADHAIGDDFAFNGIWVFHDTNGNGLFDQPVKSASGGVTFVDYPMFPGREGLWVGAGAANKADSRKSTVPLNNGVPRWEYVSFPPDGGDPWWKIKLPLTDGRRRPDGDTSFSGYVEATPNIISTALRASRRQDYFVVIRPDSGYQDVSLKPGDGTGFTPGTDFRAFIEPRRFNAATGKQDGGIYVDSQCALPTIFDDSGNVINAWQDDARWTASEPWWPERTLNASNAKPVRNGVEVHDLTLTYGPNSDYASFSAIDYQGSANFGYKFEDTSLFTDWMDPFGLQRSHFFYGNAVGVSEWILWFNVAIPGSIAYLGDDSNLGFQFPYETVPFFSPTFDIASSPRSILYNHPPAQPTLPDFSTWPATLAPGQYPQAADWDPQFRKARILHQHIEPSSEPTALLGFNLVGVDDPVTNRIAPIKLTQINVAFWGPDFDPEDLKPLDANGSDTTSGVLLYQDDAGGLTGGVFDVFLGNDTPVPLANLAWRTAPELIDVDGDGVADDLNGDGVVDSRDRAWVLTINPRDPWVVPISDERTGGGIGTIISTTTTTKSEKTDAARAAEADTAPKAEQKSGVQPQPQRKSVVPTTINLDEARAALAQDAKKAKALDPGGNPGDDLFLVIRTSDKVRRFEQFRAVVPATLPDRPLSDRQAGIKLFPNNVVYPKSYAKLSPDEGVVQDYFKHDLMEANVPTKLVDLTTSGQVIAKNSPPTAILGIDASTNRGSKGTEATGTNGVGGNKSLSVTGATWTVGAFVGDFLVDGNFESYEITGNTANTLTLLSGTPKNGFYLIAKDPSFLETVTVEFYDNYDGKFKIQEDLLPLDVDQTKSGVAIYRDNTLDPSNHEGVFDPLIDIPVKLDVAPYLSGVAGEPQTQVRFVFSTPGTDNLGPGAISQSKALQTRHRQWVPDTFDTPYKGPDFFVVIRTSNGLKIGDGFGAGIVAWGPNTPTEPDPDTFPPYPASLRPDEFDLFSEFPWGSRAVGYISFFKDPSTLIPPDNSGFNWVRSTIAQAIRTTTVYGGTPVPAPDDVVITSASRNTLPSLVGAAGLPFTISGSGFGATPQVTLNGIPLIVTSSTNTLIAVTIPAGTQITVTPVLLKVTNPANGKFAVRDDLFTVPAAGAVSITSVSPNVLPAVVGAGGLSLSILGSGFGTTPQVVLNGKSLTVTAATNTTIAATIPANTQFNTLPIVMTVTNPTTKKSETRDDLFTLAGGPPPPPDVVIASVSKSVFPVTAPQGGIAFTINGSGFGTSPKVKLQGVVLTVNSATDTAINVTVPGGTTFSSDVAMTLNVQNPITGKEASRDDLISLASQPTILTVSPNHGPSSAFPVKITGTNFDQPTVYFGETLVPVQSFTTTEIIVSFPTGGFPETGPLDVKVINASTVSVTLADGFSYENPPVPGPPRPCFIATAAYGTPLEKHLTTFRSFRDGVLLKSSLGAALVDEYYTASPAIADVVAEHPALAFAVRFILTPIAWVLEAPLTVGAWLSVVAGAACAMLRFKRSASARRRAQVD